MEITTLTPHPAALAYGAMSAADYQNLKADIKANGLVNPIILLGDQIVDGIHRYKACEELGKMARFENLDTDRFPDVADYIRSVNDARRHATHKERLAAMNRVLTAKPVASNAEAAAAAGVSETTARRARKAAGVPTAVDARAEGVKAAILASPNASNRALAAELGVSKDTVRRVRDGVKASNDETAPPVKAVKPKAVPAPVVADNHDKLAEQSLAKVSGILLRVDPTKLTDPDAFFKAVRALVKLFNTKKEDSII